MVPHAACPKKPHLLECGHHSDNRQTEYMHNSCRAANLGAVPGQQLVAEVEVGPGLSRPRTDGPLQVSPGRTVVADGPVRLGPQQQGPRQTGVEVHHLAARLREGRVVEQDTKHKHRASKVPVLTASAPQTTRNPSLDHVFINPWRGPDMEDQAVNIQRARPDNSCTVRTCGSCSFARTLQDKGTHGPRSIHRVRYASQGYLSESTAACWSPRYASSMTPMVVHARVNRLVMPPVSPAPCTALNTCEQQYVTVKSRPQPQRTLADGRHYMPPPSPCRVSYAPSQEGRAVLAA